MKKPILLYAFLVLLTAFYIACGSDDGTTPPTDDGSGITDDDPSTDDDPMVVAPKISSFSPTQGTVGTDVTIKGSNFSATTSENIVKFNGTKAAVTQASTIELTATVPSGAKDGPISVEVDGEKAISTASFTVTTTEELVLSIIEFEPLSGTPGTIVTITGTKFGPTIAENIVEFNDEQATITEASTNSLKAEVPVGATNGPISITVNGETVTSVSDFGVLPTPLSLDSFEPTNGIIGTVVTIHGEAFSTTLEENIVEFNGVLATVISATSSELQAKVPHGATNGKIRVTTTKYYESVDTVDDFIVPEPTITSFSPDQGTTGTEVIIVGTNFSPTIEHNIVAFNGIPGIITEAQAAQLTVDVPEEATTGKISVNVGGQEVESADDFTMWSPTISNFEPQQGVVGDLITIHGEHFHTTPANNIVKFNGVTATVQSATATQLKVLVPDDATTGKISVLVGNQEGESTEDFTLPWKELASFPGVPRYGAVVAVLEDGNGDDIIIGGLGYSLSNGLDLKDIWVYSIQNNTWKSMPNFPGIARHGAFSFVLENHWYVGSGHNGGLGSFNDFRVYDPINETWTQLNNSDIYLKHSAAFVLMNKGYVYGGKFTTFNYGEKLHEFNPNNNPEWSLKSDLELNNSGRSQAAAFAINGKGYVGTGYDGKNSNTFQDLWEYDPGSNTWSQKANYGGGQIRGGVGFTITNKGYIGLGVTEANFSNYNFWEYDNNSNTWKQKSSFPGVGRWGANAVTHEGKAYILFGDSTDSSEELRFLEYTPALDN